MYDDFSSKYLYTLIYDNRRTSGRSSIIIDVILNFKSASYVEICYYCRYYNYFMYLVQGTYGCSLEIFFFFHKIFVSFLGFFFSTANKLFYTYCHSYQSKIIQENRGGGKGTNLRVSIRA